MIEDYIRQGHAEPAPFAGVSGRTWYLPHQAVTHSRKPGKFRVVYDCAAKSHGVSLNNHLLQVPDFVNDLVGVLIRFRQEPVAVRFEKYVAICHASNYLKTTIVELSIERDFDVDGTRN